MGTPAEMSERNFTNSVATYLASELLTNGYLVYWHTANAVETPDGWYADYTTTDYSGDSVLQARLAASRGLVTLRPRLTANTVFVVRPTTSSAIGARDEVVVPAFAVDVEPMRVIGNMEIGTRIKLRARHLIVQGFARDESEQAVLASLLEQVLDDGVSIDITDHDASTPAVVGSALVTEPTVLDDIVLTGAEATTFAVEAHARLTYEA